SAVKRRLEGKYELVALNRRRVEDIECHQADISDLKAILPAFEGVDSVVHLAAVSGVGDTWQSYLNSSIIGTYNVFEASRMSGVKRIVYASSGAIMAGIEKTPPYD